MEVLWRKFAGIWYSKAPQINATTEPGLRSLRYLLFKLFFSA